MAPIVLLTTPEHSSPPQLQALLTFLFVNDPEKAVRLYLLHSGIPEEKPAAVRRQCGG